MFLTSACVPLESGQPFLDMCMWAKNQLTFLKKHGRTLHVGLGFLLWVSYAVYRVSILGCNLNEFWFLPRVCVCAFNLHLSIEVILTSCKSLIYCFCKLRATSSVVVLSLPLRKTLAQSSPRCRAIVGCFKRAGPSPRGTPFCISKGEPGVVLLKTA